MKALPPSKNTASPRAELIFMALAAACVSFTFGQPAGIPSADTSARRIAEVLDDSIAALQHRLDGLRTELQRLDLEQTELDQREQASLHQLELLGRRISALSRYLDLVAAQIRQRNREIARIIILTDSLRQAAESKRLQLTERVKMIYKYARVFPLRALFTSHTLPDAYRRVLSLRLIARDDRRILEEHRALQSQLQTQYSQLLSARHALEQLTQESLAQHTELHAARAQQTAVLDQIRTARNANRAAGEQLRAQSQQLSQLLLELERTRTQALPASGFAALRSQLPWPVYGRIIARFGSRTHPRYRTKTTNLGLDIKPSGPSRVLAVAAGRVVYSDRFLGYGNLVIIDHGGGYYTLYANLDELDATVGEEVLPGTSLGLVSDYVHFEIRHEGQPIDPEPWLVSR